MTRLAAIAILLAATVTGAAADEWYVIVKTGRVGPAVQDADLARVEAAASRCHVEVFNDFSDKFIGFAPGHYVFVVGPYTTKVKAQRALTVAKPCFPGAYVKRGRYAGE